jgi:hypothetical protein
MISKNKAQAITISFTIAKRIFMALEVSFASCELSKNRQGSL